MEDHVGNIQSSLQTNPGLHMLTLCNIRKFSQKSIKAILVTVYFRLVVHVSQMQKYHVNRNNQ